MLAILIAAMSTLGMGAEIKPECRPWANSPVKKVMPVLDTCYVIFAESLKLDWDDAKTYCDERGGMLAKILNDETDVYLSQVLPHNEQFWIGLSRQKKEDGNGYAWVYTDGEESEFSLLYKPPNYMESTVIHAIFIEVWTDLQTSPWHVGQTSEERRFMCQYIWDAPPDLPFPTLPTTASTSSTRSTTTAMSTTTTTPPTTTTIRKTTTTTPRPTTTTTTTTTPKPTTQRPRTTTTTQSTTTTTTTTRIPTTTTTTTTPSPPEKNMKTVISREYVTTRIHTQNIVAPPDEVLWLHDLACLAACAERELCRAASFKKATTECRLYNDLSVLQPANMGNEKGWGTFKIIFLSQLTI